MAVEGIEHEPDIPQAEDDLDQVIQLAEETLVVGTRKVERGRMLVHLTTETTTQVARVALQQEDIVVDRVSINQPVTTAPEVREENGVTIIPILEEVVVITKQLVLREELHIRRLSSTREVAEPVELRRQQATTEYIAAGVESPIQ